MGRVLLAFIVRWWRWIGVAALVAAAVWMLAQGVTAEGQVRVRAEKFRRALATKDSTRAWKMVSIAYADQWGLDRDGVRLAMQDCTSQFLALDVEWIDPRFEAVDGAVAVTARARLAGRSLTPAGEMILSRAAQLREPFVFRWEKEGWWPWTWKLTSIGCPGLEIPQGYRPGMLSEGLKGGDAPALDPAMFGQ